MPPDLAERPFKEARSRSLRRIAYGLLAHSFVSLFGLVGYMANGWGFLDALYMVIITVSTVGYGEVRPVNTIALRIHSMTLIALGTLTLTYTVAAVLQFIAEGEIQRILGHQRVKRQIENLRDHFIVAGIGRMGSLICSELSEAGAPFVVIDRSEDRVPEMEARGWLFLIGDATQEVVLRAAGLERARALVISIPNDAENVFITLTAREMAPNVRILARAEQPSTQKKLLQAGADHVVLPAAIGAHRAVSMLLNPGAVEFSELVTKTTGEAFEMVEVLIQPGDPFAGQTLRKADIGRRTGAMVIAIKKADGKVDFPPRGDTPLAIDDSIILLGRPENLERFRELFPAG